MRRRAFLTMLGGVGMVASVAARAQQPGKVYRVGLLWDSPSVQPDAVEAFRGGLHDLGWAEGQNLVIEHRWTEDRFDRIQAHTEELLALKVDVIIAPTSIYTEAARRATTTTPIVFLVHADPVASGHVPNLTHPGGNITGLSLMLTETNVKLLELIKEAVPGLTRVAVLWNPATPSHRPGLAAIEAAAGSLRLDIQAVAASHVSDFEGAFAAMVRERAGGVLVLATPLFNAEAKSLADLALKHKLPSLFAARAYAKSGGLMSFGPDRADLWRRGAIYVDKIFRGAKPGDLPVQQPTKFELVVNLKTAKALGLAIPPAFLARADEVIE